MSESLFKPYDPRLPWGMFGYSGYCCDVAIQRDDPDQAEECWRRGWMDVNTECTMSTVVQKCDRVAPKVAERLRKLGPCKNQPEHAGA